jgi:hypothetical protein
MSPSAEECERKLSREILEPYVKTSYKNQTNYQTKGETAADHLPNNAAAQPYLALLQADLTQTRHPFINRPQEDKSSGLLASQVPARFRRARLSPR